jgi:hypothetical protein
MTEPLSPTTLAWLHQSAISYTGTRDRWRVVG